jgi:hypothetical protein
MRPDQRAESKAEATSGIKLVPMSVLVPYTLEQDESGTWCARADLGAEYGVVLTDGETPEAALDSLAAGVQLVFRDEGGAPAWLMRGNALAIPDVA